LTALGGLLGLAVVVALLLPLLFGQFDVSFSSETTLTPTATIPQVTRRAPEPTATPESHASPTTVQLAEYPIVPNQLTPTLFVQAIIPTETTDGNVKMAPTDTATATPSPVIATVTNSVTTGGAAQDSVPLPPDPHSLQHIPTATLTQPQSSTEYVTYVVKPGDSLSSIAARFGTTVGAIMSTNDLQSTLIVSGQVLRISVKRTP